MSKHIIPLGDRIVVRRRKVGEKLGSSGLIVAAETTQEAKTDIADVVYVPEHSFADKKLIGAQEKIVGSQVASAMQGDAQALIALLQFNTFLKIKSIKPGDTIFMGKYSGIDIADNSGEQVTIVRGDDIVGVVSDE